MVVMVRAAKDQPAEKARSRRASDGRRSAARTPGRHGEPSGIGLDTPIYTLSVAAELLETHQRTLMMYEHLGMIKPARTSTNRRRYTQRDLLKLQAIQRLTRQHGVNLAGARLILAMLKTLQEHDLDPPAALRGLDVRQLHV
jgi:MerR family transcriptional regulator/heat shock protein HspR